MSTSFLTIILVCTSFVACQQPSEQTLAVAVNQIAVGEGTPKTTLDGREAPPVTASKMVFQSLDGGETWEDISSGLPRDMYPTSIYARDGEVFLGTMNGIYSNRVARPLAPDWQKEHLLNVIQHEFIATMIPAKDGVIARSHPSGFFQNMPKTGMWKPICPEMAKKEVNTMITCANGVRLITTNDGIYRSVYGGRQWGKVFTQGQVLSMIEVNGVLLGAGEIGVVRSIDGGNHWTWVLTEDGRSRKTVLIDQVVYSISMGSGKREQFESDPTAVASKLRRSTDSGLTWKLLDPEHTLGQRIYDIHQIGDALLCSSNLGIFTSIDQGISWTLIRASQSEQAIPSITVDGPVIYVVDTFGGC